MTACRWRVRIAALPGDRDQAIELLRQAFAEDRYQRNELHSDPDLQGLRHDAAFRAFARPQG